MSVAPAPAALPTPAHPLAGRVAIVTGASSGLGRRFAQVLAGAGANVLACARRLDRLEALAAESDAIVPVQCDVAEAEARARVIATALDAFGRLDVCVNNAGISAAGPAESLSLGDFQRVMAVNVDAVFAMCQLAGVAMLRQGAGSIINISSMFGLVASTPVPEVGYATSKSAVIGLTRELGVQWAARGVRVNAIAPGWFPSEMTSEAFADERSSRWIERNCPMGRVGRPDELDGVLLFLAGDGSTYCTGQVIAVDGGWTAR
jgi:NAD(P)-dependent dehydrogenase (short-subunit alcohol dehydrogenase family)